MATTKRCECGGDMKAGYSFIDGKLQRSWECNNCIKVLARREYKRGVKTTPSQLKAIEWARNAFWSLYSYSEADYEWKRNDIETTESGDVCLTMTIGRKNDEGTLASALCRSHTFVFIGRKGQVYTYKNGKRVVGREALWAI